jgi:two-component system, NarL family, nitrate/nitrite response regulator NarL
VIRVFVAGRTAAARLALRARLDGPNLTVVGDGALPAEAPADVDVLVLDDAECWPVTADALADGGAPAVVALVHPSRPLPSLAREGLRGWALVPRDASTTELRAAATAAGLGFAVLPARLAPPAGRERVDDAESAGPVERLTPREREALELLGQGLSNREIGARLGISEHTAKFHVASIAAKLGASSRTEAVRLGVRRGLITL